MVDFFMRDKVADLATQVVEETYLPVGVAQRRISGYC